MQADKVDDALRHALQGTCGCLALGTVISSVRSRRLKAPPSVFVALSVGCGFFRYINGWRSKGDGTSKLAAWVASLVLFQLCSHQHKHVLLSYACVETIVQLYATSSLVQSTLAPTFRWLVEQCASMVVTARLVHTNLVHPEWMLPAHLAMMDHQSSLSPSRLDAIRQNLHMSATLLSVYFQLSAKYLVVSKRTGTRLAAALFATCMTYLLQHPERHSRWAMEYLYGPKLSTKSKDNDVDADMA
ncbi:hypothetical protein DYB30_014032 [Aphanomyces astaci]|uniref:Uncharacterized protein n=1 Tax=Aphanomyces astaci TaxID=112090 RepID=A0A397EDP4_APHAT|nr:hypothetical protein DYB30_014032 [Aphanomyces astaci]